MPVDEFGGDWTAEKLERVRKYLAAYTVIFARNLKAQKLTPIYVDAFAGTGYRTKPPRLDAQTALFEELAEPEAEAFLKGSARIALEVDPPFKQYVFIEQDAGRAQELEKLKQQFAERAPRVNIVREDANTIRFPSRDQIGDTSWDGSNVNRDMMLRLLQRATCSACQRRPYSTQGRLHRSPAARRAPCRSER